MEDVELVIKIPEKLYKQITVEKNYFLEDGENLCTAVENGTPLPKGHGDLKDANELKKAYDERITYLYTLNKKDNPSREAKICATNWCVNTIDELPTIIEADKDGDAE